MKHIITYLMLTFALCSYQNVFAQCNPAIPANAQVIKTSQSDHGYSSVWICSGAIDSTNSIGETAYLEPGAAIYGENGIGNTVYVPEGAALMYNGSANGNTIYFVDSADLVVTTGNATLIQCSSISYDYTNAPSGGCVTTGITVNKTFVSGDMEVYPSQAVAIIHIRYPETIKGNISFQIADIAGRQVLTQSQIASPKSEINISALKPGIYFLTMKTNSGGMSKKFVKE